MALASASAHFVAPRALFFPASCAAARAGKVDVLARAKELGAPLTADVCLAAAEGGDVPTIEAAVTLGAPLARQQVTDAWHRAIEKGRVEMMAWLREYDPKHCDWIGHRIVRPWRRVLGPCGRAARWGRLAALQWLRSSDRFNDLSHKYGRPVQINQNNGRTKHVFDDAFDVPQDQRPEQFDFMAMCNAGKSNEMGAFYVKRATQSLDAGCSCAHLLDFARFLFVCFLWTQARARGPRPWRRTSAAARAASRRGTATWTCCAGCARATRRARGAARRRCSRPRPVKKQHRWLDMFFPVARYIGHHLQLASNLSFDLVDLFRGAASTCSSGCATPTPAAACARGTRA